MISMYLNAPDGLQGFIDRLGPMMKRLGADARTDYDWTADQIAAIHADLVKQTPIKDIPAKQAWRDTQILALRRMKLDRSL